jgi:DNA-directed RNA polymerase subunit RPC12/RpoP
MSGPILELIYKCRTCGQTAWAYHVGDQPPKSIGQCGRCGGELDLDIGKIPPGGVLRVDPA